MTPPRPPNNVNGVKNAPGYGLGNYYGTPNLSYEDQLEQNRMGNAFSRKGQTSGYNGLLPMAVLALGAPLISKWLAGANSSNPLQQVMQGFKQKVKSGVDIVKKGFGTLPFFKWGQNSTQAPPPKGSRSTANGTNAQ